MANYEEAINDVKYLSTRLRGLISLADFLEDFASLENRLLEKTKLLEETNNNLNETITALNASREQLSQTKEDLAVHVKRAYQEADAIRNDAVKEAELIVLQAQYKAQDEINRLKVTETLIRTQIEDARTELKEVEAEILLKSQSLANIENKLQTLRESLNG